jgi:hypothetical protein
MTAWTVATTMAYARPERRTRLLLSADLVVTAGLLLSTAALQYPSAMERGVMPVTGIWVAGPVLAWAVQYGRRAGAIAVLILSGCDFLLRSAGLPPGAARLAAAAGAPLVPAGISGTRALLPPGGPGCAGGSDCAGGPGCASGPGRPRRVVVTVRFGAPVFVGPVCADPADALGDATAEARERVVALATGSPKEVKPGIHSAPTP